MSALAFPPNGPARCEECGAIDGMPHLRGCSNRLRAAFRDVALGLMEWQDPPLMGRREYARLELLDAPRKWTPPPGDLTEPFDVDADWSERA